MEQRSWGSTEHLAAEFLSSSLSHQDARAQHLALVTAAIRREFGCSTAWKLTELLHSEPALLGVRCSDPKPMQPQEMPSPEPCKQSHLPGQDLVVCFFFFPIFQTLPLPLSQSTELQPQQGLVGPCRAPPGVPFPRATPCTVRINPPESTHSAATKTPESLTAQQSRNPHGRECAPHPCPPQTAVSAEQAAIRCSQEVRTECYPQR